MFACSHNQNKKKPKRASHYKSAALIVGEKGKYYSPGDYGGEAGETGIIVDGEFTKQQTITRGRDGSPFSEFANVEYTKSPGHFTEFANAIRGEGKTVSEFVEYSGPLTETILLGNLAIWTGEKVDWDAEKMVAANADEKTQKMIRHEYQNGYSVHEGAAAK